jgi:RNA polymerase sigma-70 factor, ECF subfamily
LVDAPDSFRRQLLEAIPRLRRYARSLVFDSATADDLTQQALERALLHWQQFDPQRELAVWLLSIAHNAFLDQLRRDARTTVTDPSDLQKAQDHAQQVAGTGQAHDPGLRIDLQAALARLTPQQREPLLLVCVEQLSYAEVAQTLHIPIGTVMSRVCRARAAMRAALDAPVNSPAISAANTPSSATTALRRVV